MQSVIGRLAGVRRWGQQLGPYVAVAIFVPGGTLFALLMFVYQRRKTLAAASISGGSARRPTWIPRSMRERE